MNFLGNLLWIIFGGGFFIWLEYTLAGLLLCLSVIGIPLGIQCFKLAGLGLAPFGRQVEDTPRASAPLPLLANILWLVFFGFWIALSHLALALGLALSIIGIPFAWQHVKFANLALAPFGRFAD